MKYDLSGESWQCAAPAYVESTVFYGVEVLRILGTQEQITATTKMLDDVYAAEDKRTFGDAQHLGYMRSASGLRPAPLYQLIVLRRISK